MSFTEARAGDSAFPLSDTVTLERYQQQNGLVPSITQKALGHMAVLKTASQPSFTEPAPGENFHNAPCTGVDADLFFSGNKEEQAQAKELCFGCEKRLDCLDYAVANDEKYGIWGGLDEKERKRHVKSVANKISIEKISKLGR